VSWRAQSLSQGAAGIALLHIERAHLRMGSWRDAHSWVTVAAGGAISAADDAGLFFGAPALAFVLHAAGADGIARYGPALAGIDAHVSALTHRRVEDAHARIDRRDLAAFAEYDLLRGLTGIGAHLLRHAPGNDALGRVLTYLVRLTQPLRTDGETVPGWWVFHDPHIKDSAAFPGGHANLGLAHGVAGPLALLAQSLRQGITVDGHLEAMNTISSWLDTWRHDADPGPWWPQWITRDQLRTGRSNQRGPLRPSWCYGTPGLARAQQIAAVATSDTRRQQIAEHTLAGCLSDPAQLRRITDTSLCHGWAGLYQSVWHAARDALTPTIAASLPHLADHLTRPTRGAGTGLLEGDAGLALALHTATHAAPPVSGWDACLLIN
jgi:lantibiotic biosynthesis protein